MADLKQYIASSGAGELPAEAELDALLARLTADDDSVRAAIEVLAVTLDHLVGAIAGQHAFGRAGQALHGRTPLRPEHQADAAQVGRVFLFFQIVFHRLCRFCLHILWIHSHFLFPVLGFG